MYLKMKVSAKMMMIDMPCVVDGTSSSVLFGITITTFEHLEMFSSLAFSAQSQNLIKARYSKCPLTHRFKLQLLIYEEAMCIEFILNAIILRGCLKYFWNIQTFTQSDKSLISAHRWLYRVSEQWTSHMRKQHLTWTWSTTSMSPPQLNAGVLRFRGISPIKSFQIDLWHRLPSRLHRLPRHCRYGRAGGVDGNKDTWSQAGEEGRRCCFGGEVWLTFSGDHVTG